MTQGSFKRCRCGIGELVRAGKTLENADQQRKRRVLLSFSRGKLLLASSLNPIAQFRSKARIDGENLWIHQQLVEMFGQPALAHKRRFDARPQKQRQPGPAIIVRSAS